MDVLTSSNIGDNVLFLISLIEKSDWHERTNGNQVPSICLQTFTMFSAKNISWATLWVFGEKFCWECLKKKIMVSVAEHKN